MRMNITKKKNLNLFRSKIFKLITKIISKIPDDYSIIVSDPHVELFIYLSLFNYLTFDISFVLFSYARANNHQIDSFRRNVQEKIRILYWVNIVRYEEHEKKFRIQHGDDSYVIIYNIHLSSFSK